MTNHTLSTTIIGLDNDKINDLSLLFLPQGQQQLQKKPLTTLMFCIKYATEHDIKRHIAFKLLL